MLSVHFSASILSTGPIFKRDPAWDQGHGASPLLSPSERKGPALLLQLGIGI